MSDVAGGILLIGVGVGALYAAYSGVPQKLYGLYKQAKGLQQAGQNVADCLNNPSACLTNAANGAASDQKSGLCGTFGIGWVLSNVGGGCQPAGNPGSKKCPGSQQDYPLDFDCSQVGQGGPYAATVLPNGRLAWTPVPSAPTGSF